MIPFYPKFGAAEDAPGYGPASSEDRCETCAAYRNLGQQGYCEKFAFMADPEYSCDDYRPAGVVKESSLSGIASSSKEAIEKKVGSAKRVAKSAVRLDAKRAIEEARKGALVPKKYEDALKALDTVYPTKTAANDRSAFLQGMHPIPGGVVTQAVDDRLDEDTTADDMKRRKRLAMLGGAISGGILVPGAVAVGIGGARGALARKGLSKLPGAAIAARTALKDTFHRASIPALSAGAGIGALGAGAQYDVGTTLAELAKDKVASNPYLTFGAAGAGLMGTKSLLSDKDKILRDLRLRREGKISGSEIKDRLKNYGLAAGANAAVGGALGAGSVYGFRRLVKPELIRMGDEAAGYAGKKIEQASETTLKSIDDLATKHRKASAEEARRLADSQRAAYSKEISRKGDELVDKMQKADLLEGTRKGMSRSSAAIPVEHRIALPGRDKLERAGDRLRRMFSREDKYARLNRQLAAEEAAEAAVKAGS